MPCNCKTALRLCDNGYCACFRGGAPCVAACHNGVAHPFGCNNGGGGRGGGAAVMGALPPPPPMPPAVIAVGGGGPPDAVNDLIKKFREEIIVFVVISSLSFIYFWGHPFPLLFTIALITVFLLLFGALRHKLFSLPQCQIITVAFMGVFYVTAPFFLEHFRYFVVKDCLEYPVQFILPSPFVPHPYLESIVEGRIKGHVDGKESIHGIAGPMYHGKTSVVKKLLNGRKHTIFTDLTEVKVDNIESHLIQSFVGNPRNAFLNLMKLDFHSTLSTLAQVAMSYDKEEPLVIVIDGAMALYGDVIPSTGKINAPLVKIICTKLSPHAVVLFIFSGSTILSKVPFVSHAGGRTRIELSKPITNNTAMLEWFLSQKGSEGLSRIVGEKIVGVLNGKFNDYEELLLKVQNQNISIDEAFLILQETTRDFLLGKLQLDDVNVEKSKDKSIFKILDTVERFEVVRLLAFDESTKDTDKSPIRTNREKTTATNHIVTGLVEDNILFPYPNYEILFESNLKKTVAKTLVQEPHILEKLRKRLEDSTI